MVKNLPGGYNFFRTTTELPDEQIRYSLQLFDSFREPVLAILHTETPGVSQTPGV
jgi:hypothetical protein